MRVLTISRNKLEITRSHLTHPLMTIGRSPTCDVILRAPGIRPFHFLIEWIGEGAFSPDRGAWSITDLSTSQTGTMAEGTEHGEGQILSEDAVHLGDLTFTVVEDRLEVREDIGGTIGANLQGSHKHGTELLELVQVRIDSGAIEEIRHFPVVRKTRVMKPLGKHRNFRLEWQGEDSSTLLKVLLDEMPGAEIFKRGIRIQATPQVEVLPHDVLQVRWQGRDFFIRFVSEIKAPPIPREVMDPLLRRITVGVLLSAMILLALVKLNARYNPPEETKPPLRIATVQLPAPPKAVEPPPPPPPVETQEVAVNKKAPEPDPKQAKKKDEPLQIAPKKKNESPAKASAPRFESANAAKPKAGLNSPAKQAEVNTVGVLGALSKLSAKGKGVRADQVVNEGIITESVSAPQGNSKIVVRNPPAGVLGTGTGGSPKGEGSQNLAAASTTLKGAGKYDPNAVGPVARKGGDSGMNLGTDLSGRGSGSTGLGSMDGADFSVEGGGLDRETVRRVIASYRGAIRTCYERALLSNPRMAGRIVYHWRISPDGPVVTTNIKSATLESDSMKACVNDVISKMVFPRAANGKATQVIYPFVFQGKK